MKGPTKKELLQVLRDILPLAERGANDLMSQMVGTLYPNIVQSKIERAREVVERSESRQ
jgi:hypothetical protein